MTRFSLQRSQEAASREPMADYDLGQTLDFMQLIWALDHALQSASKRMSSTLGVTGPQRLVVRIIGRFPGIRAGQIATILRVDPSTLTGVLKRLETARLIRRQVDESDRRRATFTLTALGKQVNVTNRQTVELAVRNALRRSAGREIAITTAVLGNLVSALETVPANGGAQQQRKRRPKAQVPRPKGKVQRLKD